MQRDRTGQLEHGREDARQRVIAAQFVAHPNPDGVHRLALLLDRLTERWTGAHERTRDDFQKAGELWVGYPYFYHLIGHQQQRDAASFHAYQSLRHAHTEATAVLAETAERLGVDSGPLHLCARVIREVYDSCPEAFPLRQDLMWPAAMGHGRYSLPESQQRALDAGETAFMRMLALLDLNDACGGDLPSVRTCLPRERRRGGAPRLPAAKRKLYLEITPAWDQARDAGVTKREFISDWNGMNPARRITASMLERALAYSRKHRP